MENVSTMEARAPARGCPYPFRGGSSGSSVQGRGIPLRVPWSCIEAVLPLVGVRYPLVVRRIFMPTLYLTEDYALVRRDGEDSLLVQIPEKKGKNGAVLSPARKEHVPLIKIDEVVVLGEVTLTASAIHLLLERDVEITYLSHFG